MNVPPKLPAPCAEYRLQRWDGAAVVPARDLVAEEVPISMVYNGLAHAVMMASPADLEDFAVGFSLSEGIVERAAELHRVEVVPLDEGALLRMEIDAQRGRLLEEQRRNLAGRTACGLCGAETLEQVVRHPGVVPDGPRVPQAVLSAAIGALAPLQRLNATTGAVHAAAWATPQGEIELVREDVGRHNALDKLIGALVRERRALDRGWAVITSRASFEMVQKCAMAGISLLAAISAPTGLAIRVARETGVTLVGFARGPKHNVYTHPHRLTA